MELKTPKDKKISSFTKLISRGKMFRIPLLILLLLGSTSCDENEDEFHFQIKKSSSELQNTSLEHTHRHGRNTSAKKDLSDIKYLRRHLNREIVNFVMTDYLVDGEVENRVHYNGITAKETYVGANGSGLRLRQLTDGRHLVQVIYTPNGDIQDCEYITQAKYSRNFLKTLRKELKLALEEQSVKLSQNEITNEDEKYYRHFSNVTLRILRNGETLPIDVASWLNFDKLKMECLERHEELTFMMANKNKISGATLARSRRSLKENFIVPGTKWCGAGDLAEKYNELGMNRKEDTCCRAHDNCRLNIGPFRRRFGYFNFRPFTISNCACDRRFRACLKLANTSMSNMVGKLFFNVVQTRCFVLKPVKSCTQRSWWGRCLRRSYTKRAYLRDNMPY
ncbi:uncharacterized protein LOC125239909 isoform X2 [Leguminivora glycinivorella]|uniref:uncharacterized protein LOC125239909 isoform X2 n=1 Tax=Leguminivora glycinivorella TaxID=1035111 RepID=UPI00200FA8CE|nr:uncharacterized protein LOC125239909 isoform X2 [Leguminivora glycinivorella]